MAARNRWGLWLAAVSLVGTALLAAAPAAQTPLVVRDLDGVAHTPLVPAPGTVSLLFFITVDCPISNRYAPEITRIIADYAPRRVHAWLVYADSSLTPDRVRAHVGDFYPGTTTPAVIDRTHALTAAVGATVTPEAVVYTAAGRAYRGRIDDWYISLSQNRRAPADHTLRLALDAVLAGRPVAVRDTQPIGCYIPKDLP